MTSNTFGLSKQTFKALIQTNRAIANLCSDLLSDGYYYILTGRLQNDPLERRFSQYRQMSGGRFLVSLREVYKSESIIKLKSLFKYELEVPIRSFWAESTIQDFLNEIHTLNFEFVSLSDDTNEVIVFWLDIFPDP